MKKIATTVKVESDLYDEFKIIGIKNRITLQGLVEKCVHLYVRDSGFKNTIDIFRLPIISTTGSFSV